MAIFGEIVKGIFESLLNIAVSSCYRRVIHASLDPLKSDHMTCSGRVRRSDIYHFQEEV